MTNVQPKYWHTMTLVIILTYFYERFRRLRGEVPAPGAG